MGETEVTPRCPGCDSEPYELNLPFGAGLSTQRFCPNDECHVFIWNPTLSVEQNMAAMSTIDLPDLRPRTRPTQDE